MTALKRVPGGAKSTPTGSVQEPTRLRYPKSSISGAVRGRQAPNTAGSASRAASITCSRSGVSRLRGSKRENRAVPLSGAVTICTSSSSPSMTTVRARLGSRRSPLTPQSGAWVTAPVSASSP